MVHNTLKIGKNRYRSVLHFSHIDLMNLQKNNVVTFATGINTGKPVSKDDLLKLITASEADVANDFNAFGDSLKSKLLSFSEGEDESAMLNIPFRLVSACVVGAGGWKCTDFSTIPDKLKNSRNKLLSKPVYKNHSRSVDDCVGMVYSTTWSEKRTSEGKTIPAGIDGILSINPEADEKLASNLAAGILYSNSVTVDLDWEPSHTFESDMEFLMKCGDMGPDGKLVRRIAVEINDYHETSLVWLGADPFAKRLNEKGVPIKPQQGVAWKAIGKFAQDDYVQKKSFALSFSGDELNNLISLSRLVPKTQNNTSMTLEVENALRTALGLTATGELTAELVSTLKVVTPPSDAEKQAAALKATNTDRLQSFAAGLKLIKKEGAASDGTVVSYAATGEVVLPEGEFVVLSQEDYTALQSSITANAAFVEAGKHSLAFQREETKRLYTLAMTAKGHTADAAVLAVIDKADFSELGGLMKSYGAETAGAFSAVCGSCGNSDIELRSSILPEVTLGFNKGSKAPEPQKAVPTPDELRTKYRNKSRRNG